MSESASRLPALKKKLLSQKQLKRHNFSLGNSGEQQAVLFLKKNGYVVLDTNVAYKNKEIDIVAFDTKNQEVVFVEVKTRQNDAYGAPSQAVNSRKLRHMQIVAHYFIEHHQLDYDYRFDTIGVISGKIQHYQNVTW